MDVQIRDRIAVNAVDSSIVIPHWGITLRTLFGAALVSWPEGKPGDRRDYTVFLKDKPIAVLHVQKHIDPII